MDDLVTLAILAASVFFAVVGVGLLVRYRQLAGQINQSSDLGKDLWGALNSRMRKQDERILDLMGRVEVIQTRVLNAQTQVLSPMPAATKPEPPKAQESGHETTEVSDVKKEPESDVTAPSEISEVASQPSPEAEAEAKDSASPGQMEMQEVIEARFAMQEERFSQLLDKLASIEGKLSEHPPMVSRAVSSTTDTVARARGATKVPEGDLLQMLAEKPRTSGEIVERFRISREHASRVLEALFERGLAKKDDAHKPYVYELTVEGRKLAQGP